LLAIYIVGIFLYIHSLTTIGDIVMFTSYAGLLVTRLEQAVGFANRLFLDAPKLKEFYDVYDTEPEVRDAPDATDPGRVSGKVEFSKVSFSHDGVRPAVTDLTFTVLPGETVALVGPTGAGKSTALALLYRVFDPQSGDVKIDGMDVRGLKLASVRRNIGVVFKEVLLFNRTIAENLRIGNVDATDQELRAACKRAQALDFIDSKTDGMQSSVGERGRALSGGERQRISIARALLKDPPILILDEATSALDAATEVKVQAALEEVMKGRTTFVIAHRLATVRNATRILVFEQGCIVESGSFDELMNNNGPFAALAKAQFLSAGPMRPQIEESAESDADG
jgi:ATP-binding cassette, subfamily B, beta-glucan exporter